MNTIVVPVKDLDAAKKLYASVLGVEPYVDQPYYVGFRVGEQELGLDPNGHRNGVTVYIHVDDIDAALAALAANGGSTLESVKDVGGGRRTAVGADADGNVVGVLQQS